LTFREGLTVAVAWNPGVVSRPGVFTKVRLFFKANWLLLLRFLSLGIMWRVWANRGRDPTRLSISPQYNIPDGLTPAEAGTLIDNRPDMRDITAGLVDLAIRGYMRIEEVEKKGLSKVLGSDDFRIVRLKEADEWGELKDHEKEILRGLFAVTGSTFLSSLAHEFYTHLPQIRTDLYTELMDRKYYHHRPDKIWQAYLALAGVVLAAGLAGGIPLAKWLQLPVTTAVIAAVGSALPVFIFAFFMPARSVKGVRVLERLLGFEKFLERVESDRFEHMVKTPEMFEKFLPYAMAFGSRRSGPPRSRTSIPSLRIGTPVPGTVTSARSTS
jgi:hypothetical protein